MHALTRQLELEVDRAVQALEDHPRAARVLDGTATARELAGYYVTALVAVERATCLLARSRDVVRARGGSADLVAMLSTNCEQEQGHDGWLLQDLADIGFAPCAPNIPAPAEAGYLYNEFHDALIPHCGEAFLGTAFVLESLSVRCAGRAADNLRTRGRIAGLRPGSPVGVRFLSSHHDADVGHVADMATALPQLVTDARAQRYVTLAARFTATVYADFFG